MQVNDKIKFWKVLTILIILNLVIPTVFSMSAEQQQGYDLEISEGKILVKDANRIVENSDEAYRFAQELSKSKYSSETVLIRGGSTSSKYTTRDFARVFIPNFNHAPDFIKIKGNKISIIEVKRSGTYTTEQIRAFNELATTLSRRGFKVEQLIACIGPCKLPSGWSRLGDKWFKPKPSKLVTPIVSDSGITFLKWAGGALTVLMVKDLIESSISLSYKADYVGCTKGNVRSQMMSVVPPPDALQPSVTYEQCYCKTGKERDDCCYKVTYKGYTVLDVLRENKQCGNTYEYKLKICKGYLSQKDCGYSQGTDRSECEKKKESECRAILSSMGITGAAIVEKKQVSCNTGADTNCDGKVSEEELNKYTTLWVNDKISREEMNKAITAWQNS